MRNAVFTADSSGNIADCGQGGGYGVAIEPISGTFPVNLVFDRAANDPLPMTGAYSVYFADRFDELRITGATPGGQYRVWTFVDPKEGIASLLPLAAPAGATLLQTWQTSIVFTASQAYFGQADGSISTAVGPPVDCRKFRRVMMTTIGGPLAGPSNKVVIAAVGLTGPLGTSPVYGKNLLTYFSGHDCGYLLCQPEGAGGAIHVDSDFTATTDGFNDPTNQHVSVQQMPPLWIQLEMAVPATFAFDCSANPFIAQLWGFP